jgi:spectinomycin phosphotransferase
VLNPPEDLDTGTVAEALECGWVLGVRGLAYLPLGFGAHHWAAETAAGRFFVTAHDVRLSGAGQDALVLRARTFRAARTLREQGQLSFVAAALPDRAGEPVIPLGESYALSLYDWLDDAHPLDDPDGTQTAAVLAQLHPTSAALPGLDAPREIFAIPHRIALETALRSVGVQWHAGPYAEPARALLRPHQVAVFDALAFYDRLADRVRRLDLPWCLTHGEPNGSNLLQDATGRPHLVDWDSARWAPPERDLWLVDHQPQSLETYQRLTGGQPADPDILRLYRLWYDLAETAVYLLQFRQPHADDANMTESWQNFQHFLPTSERWPDVYM